MPSSVQSTSTYPFPLPPEAACPICDTAMWRETGSVSADHHPPACRTRRTCQYPSLSSSKMGLMLEDSLTSSTDCKHKTCRKHTPHKVTQYKKGKDSLAAQGKRRYDRESIASSFALSPSTGRLVVDYIDLEWTGMELY